MRLLTDSSGLLGAFSLRKSVKHESGVIIKKGRDGRGHGAAGGEDKRALTPALWMSKYGTQSDSVAVATWTLFIVTVAQKPPFRIMKAVVVLALT